MEFELPMLTKAVHDDRMSKPVSQRDSSLYRAQREDTNELVTVALRKVQGTVLPTVYVRCAAIKQQICQINPAPWGINVDSAVEIMKDIAKAYVDGKPACELHTLRDQKLISKGYVKTRPAKKQRLSEANGRDAGDAA